MKGIRGSSRKGYTRVLDSNRLVNRLDRVLSNDRANISSESRRRWQTQRRNLLRGGNQNSGSGTAKQGRYQTMGRAFRPLSSSRRARNSAAAAASVHQHVASGEPVRGTVRFEYPINMGGQPRMVEGQLEFEAGVQDGKPFVTIPLADNINLDESPSATYRPTDKAQLGLVSEEAINRSKLGRSEFSESIPPPQNQALQGFAANRDNSKIDPKGLHSSRARFQASSFYRQNALRSYIAVADNDDYGRSRTQALAIA